MAKRKSLLKLSDIDKYLIDGKEFLDYPSYREYVAGTYGVNRHTLYSRIRSGYTPQQAATVKTGERVTPNKNCKPFTADGVYYNSMSEYCRIHKISRRRMEALRSWHKDATPEELTILYAQNNTGVMVFGEFFHTINEACDKYEISQGIVLGMYSKTKDINQAFLLAMDIGFVYEGVWYRNFAMLCNSHGMQIVNVAARLALGWTLKSALCTPVITRVGEWGVYDGVEYQSKMELCRIYSIDYNTVKNQCTIYNATFMGMFDALIKFFKDMPGREDVIVRYCPYMIVDNIWYYKLDEFTSKYKLPYTTFKTYVGRSGSPHEAIDYYRNATHILYFDNNSKKYLNCREYERVNNRSAKVDARQGKVHKKRVVTYPQLKDVGSKNILYTRKLFTEYMDKLFVRRDAQV